MAAARNAARTGAGAPGAPPTALLGLADNAIRLLKVQHMPEPWPSASASTTAPSV